MAEKILILNSFVKGWNILKSLGRDGFEVNAGDYRKGAPGLYSKYITDKSKNLIYPNPKVDENEFVDAVIDHLSKHKFDIVLPVNAAEMMALAGQRERIPEGILFPFESYDKLLLLHDKKYFFEIISGNFAKEMLPKSWSVGNQSPHISEILDKAGLSELPVGKMEDYANAEQFLESNSSHNFPLIVKTRRATSSVGVYRVNSESELSAACAKLSGVDIIIQENIVGRGTGISSIRWTSPDITYHFGHKRIREYPISGGASTCREPWDIDNLPLTSSLSKLLDKLDWHGVVMFEFKEFQNDDGNFEYKFLEANPRFWGSVPLAIANGVNFPVLLCRAALNKALPIVNNTKSKRARIFFSDSLSLLLNLLHFRRICYNLKDYFNFRNIYIDDIDFKDFPATRKIVGQMFSEFFSRKKR